MLNKKWMVLSLLIGNILLIAIAAANPIYTETVLQRTLESSLSNYVEKNNRYPLVYTVRSTSLMNDSEDLYAMEKQIEATPETVGLPMKDLVKYYTLYRSETETDLDRTDKGTTFYLGSLSDLADHVSIIEGSGMTKKRDENGVVDVIVSEACLRESKLILGETITYTKYSYADGSPVKVRVAGIFTYSDREDTYWVNSPSSYTYTLFMDSELFASLFLTPDNRACSAAWYAMYDYSDLKVEGVQQILTSTEETNRLIGGKGGMKSYNNYTETLGNFLKTEKKVRTTFLVLQVPIFALLAAFILMVANQLLGMEQGEIAVLKSRGAGRRQVIGIYVLQSLMLEAASLAAGIPLALWLTRVLFSANAFLEFVRRRNVEIILNNTALIYAGIAALVSALAMTVPVFKYSRMTIVNQKQKKHRNTDVPFWQRYFVDLVILGVSIYGLYTFNNEKAYLSERVLSGESLDPLLFLSSSLFMLGAGLFILRILPMFVKLIFNLFKKQWSPAVYTSFVRILRTRKQQGAITVFLVMTIALGIFNASAARTINNNDEDNLRYTTGADVVVQENWTIIQEGGTTDMQTGMVTGGKTAYIEPSFLRYEDLEGAESLTKVYIDKKGTVNVSSGKVSNVEVMGIETKKFGETANFDTSLMPIHWYNYLNVLSQRSNSILMSSNFKNYGFRVGDLVTLKSGSGSTVFVTVYGFVDYWPSWPPATYEKDTDGIMRERENFLVVANLNYLQANWGVLPYQIWMKNKTNSTYIYEFAEETDASFKTFTDTAQELVKRKNDAVLQGTNGIFTVGFIVALVLCTVGFLIYWILSVRSRELQFGIFRAMGMSMGDIIHMLVNEHLFISGGAILAGVVTGVLTARLFIPLIMIAYSSSDYSIPLRIINDPGDFIRLGIIIGLMIFVCLMILAAIIRKMKIAQALKLGED